jgi:ATP-dependent Clp protease adaptor protein ClpS
MTTSNTNHDSDIITVTRVVVQPPKKFNVVFFNDDKTTMEFVILVLMSIFHKSFEDAHELTLIIDEKGRGIAGTYSHEIASQKRDETLIAAKANKFPLRVEVQQV